MRPQLQHQLMYYLPQCWLGCGCHISCVCNSRLDLAWLQSSCLANHLSALLPCRKIVGGNGALWLVALKMRDCLLLCLTSNLRCVPSSGGQTMETRCVYDLYACMCAQHYSVSLGEVKLMRQQISVLPVSSWSWCRCVFGSLWFCPWKCRNELMRTREGGK